MRRPTKWNGVLINDLDYVGAKDSARSCYWLMNGYGLSGTARNPQRTYNYDPAREQDELMQLIDMFAERYGKPKTVVQYGHSGGGVAKKHHRARKGGKGVPLSSSRLELHHFLL